MPTRADLLSLPIGELRQRADAALRASAIRHGLPPARSLGLSRQMMAQIVITAMMRARYENGRGAPEVLTRPDDRPDGEVNRVPWL